MEKATALYNEFSDMDRADYIETYESDILFINELIKLYGVNDARQILKNYFE